MKRTLRSSLRVYDLKPKGPRSMITLIILRRLSRSPSLSTYCYSYPHTLLIQQSIFLPPITLHPSLLIATTTFTHLPSSYHFFCFVTLHPSLLIATTTFTHLPSSYHFFCFVSLLIPLDLSLFPSSLTSRPPITFSTLHHPSSLSIYYNSFLHSLSIIERSRLGL